ncbi:MAG: nucleotide sugar dehydrogenase [Candidatus Thorarchaeota archaeon]
MRVLIVGAGYVGLSTALVISSKHRVILVDKNPEYVSNINNGITPILEPGAEDNLRRALDSNSLVAQTELSTKTHQDVVIICVDTPAQEDGSVDLSSVKSVAESIRDNFTSISDGQLLIALRSTAPPGTSRNLLLDPLTNDGFHVGVVYNPEFLRQGQAIHDLLHPDRIVIGESDERAGKQYVDMLTKCLKIHDVPIHHMSLESSELCKYASNCILATKVSFVGEISGVAENTPYVDINDVMIGVTDDHRISPSHLKPGLGFGGSCLPKDLSGLISYGESIGLDMHLLKSVRSVNQTTIKRIMRILSDNDVKIQGEKVAVLGLAFKADTVDSRGSSTLSLIEELHSAGASVWIHDPVAIPNLLQTKFNFTRDIEDCVKNTRAVILMTDWEIYRKLGLAQLLKGAREKFFIDGQRIFVNSTIPEGVTYRAFGSYYHSLKERETESATKVR